MSAEFLFGAFEFLFTQSTFSCIIAICCFPFWAKCFLFENFSSVLENFTCSDTHIGQISSLNSDIFYEIGLIRSRYSILFYSCFPKTLFCFLFENFSGILENNLLYARSFTSQNMFSRLLLLVFCFFSRL